MYVRGMLSGRRFGFTLIEILVVMGVIAVLAGILLPVLARIREKGNQTACASNLHQLGLAIFAYTEDSDEHHPVELTVSPFTSVPPVITNAGWAGLIYPYVKNERPFVCPDDPTGAITDTTRVPVSYALNSNLASAPSEATLIAPVSTVLLFEVSGDQAAVTLMDEGVASASSPQISAAGDGVTGALISLTGLGSTRPDGAVYATGRMDNIGDGSMLPFDQYQNPVGRHSIGSNFLAADGHAKWQTGSQVSAGANALAPSNPQAPTGCKINSLGSAGGFPCAEGPTNGAHTLTFSVL